MPTQIEKDAAAVLHYIAEAPRLDYVGAEAIAKATNLTPERLNDAVAFLVDSGYAEWIQTFGTAPFDFADVMITSRGRYESQRLLEQLEQQKVNLQHWFPAVGRAALAAAGGLPSRPPSPVGSPYGFKDEDWEELAGRKQKPDHLYVVLGHQSSSKYFVTAELRRNVRHMFEEAVARHNEKTKGPQITLEFKALAAGYGEHLFNEIARDIIGADIAVFETSDLNPNVMLEMGVALTWGVRVLPIKFEGQPKPPSDVSGQTWADYRDSAREFVEPDHIDKLVQMIGRALQKKGRP